MPGPHCIVEVRWGRRSGTKMVIPPGRSLRVGRTARAGLVIPHDRQLSGEHFELRWDGRRCTLRDLESLTGTRLDGELVKQAEVAHGGWIQAGETDFMVYVEGRTPPPEEPEHDLDDEERQRREERRVAAEKVFVELQEEAKAPLYALLDAARDDRILELLRESVESHQSLYEGQGGEPLDDVAPYLVGPMGPASKLLERLVLEGWGRRWGIFCTSAEPFHEVRRHWRRFLMVELEEGGKRVYFRFYDPGVLRVFLPICTNRQILELTASLDGLFFEDAGHELIKHRAR